MRRKKLLIPPLSAAIPKPYYEQIVDGIRREVSTGRLAPHTPLPSFRELAEDLVVSLITVSRAYAELEHAGVIYRRQGLGTFVAEHGIDRSRDAKTEEVVGYLRRAVEEARDSEWTDGQITAALKGILAEPQGKEHGNGK